MQFLFARERVYNNRAYNPIETYGVCAMFPNFKPMKLRGMYYSP
jgi:hypothetical protein